MSAVLRGETHLTGGPAVSAAEVAPSCEDLSKPRWLREIHAMVTRGAGQVVEAETARS